MRCVFKIQPMKHSKRYSLSASLWSFSAVSPAYTLLLHYSNPPSTLLLHYSNPLLTGQTRFQWHITTFVWQQINSWARGQTILFYFSFLFGGGGGCVFGSKMVWQRGGLKKQSNSSWSLNKECSQFTVFSLFLCKESKDVQSGNGESLFVGLGMLWPQAQSLSTIMRQPAATQKYTPHHN